MYATLVMVEQRDVVWEEKKLEPGWLSLVCLFMSILGRGCEE